MFTFVASLQNNGRILLPPETPSGILAAFSIEADLDTGLRIQTILSRSGAIRRGKAYVDTMFRLPVNIAKDAGAPRLIEVKIRDINVEVEPKNPIVYPINEVFRFSSKVIHDGGSAKGLNIVVPSHFARALIKLKWAMASLRVEVLPGDWRRVPVVELRKNVQDVVKVTLRQTTFADLTAGDEVNIELKKAQ